VNRLSKSLLIALIASLSLGANAEQHRSNKAKATFKSTHPCSASGRTKGSCPNYIIDHIDLLACGGLDDASNMQWQSKEDAGGKY
jgi:hypothetical protein